MPSFDCGIREFGPKCSRHFFLSPALSFLLISLARYLAEDAGFETLHLYVCAAFMKTFANQVLAASDMSEIMLLVLNWPTEHWTEGDSALLLAEA